MILKNYIFYCLLLFSLLIYCRTLNAAVEYDSRFTWKTIKTEHFYIHYHKGVKHIAHRLAIIAEKVHNQLVPKIKWHPRSRTEVVIVDNIDIANGYATWIPRNKIQIYVSRPQLHSVLNNFNDWLTLVFTHEYTHILTIDQATSCIGKMRYAFGRCCLLFPNTFLPYWAIEGIAVYQESQQNPPYGRNNSTYVNMVLRMEVAHKGLKPISKASVFPRQWPRGNVPYLYGGMFVDFLEKKYSKGKMAKFFLEHSNNTFPYSDDIIPLPYFYNYDAYYIFNKTFPSLWNEWRFWLTMKLKKDIAAIKKQGLTKKTDLTEKDEIANHPRFSKDGRYLYFVKSSPYTYTRLMRYDRKYKYNKTLCQVHMPLSLSIALDGSVWLADLEFYRNLNIYSEAFIYTGSYNQVTKKLRGIYIDHFKNKKKLVYVEQKNGLYSLIISDTRFKNREIIIDKSYVQLAFPKVSPDNLKIAFTVHFRKTIKDIVIYNIQKKTFTRVTKDSYTNIHPLWHPTEDKLLYVSDKNGVYNIYEYNFKTKSLSRITNVIGGLFAPDISPDGKTIAAVAYGKKGKLLSVISYPEKTYDTDKLEVKKLENSFFSVKPNNKKQSEQINKNIIYEEDYSPFRTVLPTAYIPLIGQYEYFPDKIEMAYGISFFGTDVLNKHMYLFDGSYFQKEKRFYVDINYVNAMFFPDYVFGVVDETLFAGKDQFPYIDEDEYYDYINYSRKLHRFAYASFHIGILDFDYVQSLQLTYFYGIERRDKIHFPNDENPDPFIQKTEEVAARVSLEYNIGNQKQYTYSISAEDGRLFTLHGVLTSKIFGSDKTHYKLFVRHAEFLPSIFYNHVILLNMRGAFSAWSDDDVFKLGKFRTGRTGIVDNGMGIRGYPAEYIKGDRFAAATIEYRFPLLQVDFGIFTFPIFFRDIWLKAFFEYGNAWAHENLNLYNFRKSAGGEVHIRITTGYLFDIAGYVGYARGFDKFGEDQVYFAFSSNLTGLASTVAKMVPHPDKYE